MSNWECNLQSRRVEISYRRDAIGSSGSSVLLTLLRHVSGNGLNQLLRNQFDLAPSVMVRQLAFAPRIAIGRKPGGAGGVSNRWAQ